MYQLSSIDFYHSRLWSRIEEQEILKSTSVGVNDIRVKCWNEWLIDFEVIFQAELLILALSDLKAFERRLTEVIASLQPATTRWRSMFFLESFLYAFYICSIHNSTIFRKYNYLMDIR